MVCSGSWRESEKEERREGRGQSPSTKLPALKVVKKCLAQETHHESYRPIQPIQAYTHHSTTTLASATRQVQSLSIIFPGLLKKRRPSDAGSGEVVC